MLLIYPTNFWSNFDIVFSLSLYLIITDHIFFYFMARLASSITTTGSVNSIVKTTKDLVDGGSCQGVDIGTNIAI